MQTDLEVLPQVLVLHVLPEEPTRADPSERLVHLKLAEEVLHHHLGDDVALHTQTQAKISKFKQNGGSIR